MFDARHLDDLEPVRYGYADVTIPVNGKTVPRAERKLHLTLVIAAI